jgi:hypothetical protein
MLTKVYTLRFRILTKTRNGHELTADHADFDVQDLDEEEEEEKEKEELTQHSCGISRPHTQGKKTIPDLLSGTTTVTFEGLHAFISYNLEFQSSL